MPELVVPFSDPLAQNSAITGGKGAVLAKLVKAKLPIPDGFVVTTAAFERGIGDMLPTIEKSIDGLPPDDQAPLVARGAALEEVSKNAIELLRSHEIPARARLAPNYVNDDVQGFVKAIQNGCAARLVHDSQLLADIPDVEIGRTGDPHRCALWAFIIAPVVDHVATLDDVFSSGDHGSGSDEYHRYLATRLIARGDVDARARAVKRCQHGGVAPYFGAE